ncbi:MAG: hypothetical protein LBN20_01565 [Endomicrobium sp.]|jgi:hypothetical protein|nr:hypothetical protein [Endomicrobium sp.]
MKENIRDVLSESFNEIKPLLSKNVEYSDDLVLMGGGAILDSMTLVSFVSTAESLIGDKFNKDITLVSPKAFSRKDSPFKTMAALGEFIESLLEE